MSQNTFDVAAPPPFNPGPPPWQPIERPRRRGWGAVIAAATVGAITASVAAVIITGQTRHTPVAEPPAPAAVTETVPAPTPAEPTPWPKADADRHICTEGDSASGAFIAQARAQMALLPVGLRTDDPLILNDPHWQSVVSAAGEFYHKAADALAGEIVPGATPILTEAAYTTVFAIHFLGDTTAEPALVYASGDALAIANATSREMKALCDRLAP